MDKLTQMRVLVRLAERKSFSAVGRDLGVTQSAVSRAITALERELGTRLVSRNTRNVTLTDVGIEYCNRCKKILADLEAADSLATEAATEMDGVIKITAPVPFGLMFIASRVARFQASYPALSINLDLNDQPLNLVEENVDIAIRLGELKNAGLVSRKLGESPFVLVASPGYLSEYGVPAASNALTKHKCLAYSRQENPLRWELIKNSRIHKINIVSTFQSNNLLVLKQGALGGLGIAQLPLWMVDDDLGAGSLERVLPEYATPSFDIHAVFPSIRQIPDRVEKLVSFIQQELQTVPYFNDVRAPMARCKK